MNSAIDIKILILIGFPIQKSPDLNLFSGSPKLIAANHAFHRLLAPRHPPCALCSLTINQITQHLILNLYTLFNCQRTSVNRVNRNLKQKIKLLLIPYFKLQKVVVEVSGLEPLTPCVQGRCSPNWAIPPLFKMHRKLLTVENIAVRTVSF